MSEHQELWAALGEAAAPQSESGPPSLPLANVDQKVGMGDRLAQRFLAGTPPLVILLFIAMVLPGYPAHSSILLAAPLLGLLVGWLLTPLARPTAPYYLPRLLGVVVVVIFYAATAVTLPLRFNRSFYADSRYLAPSSVHEFQYALETMLSHQGLGALILLVLTLGGLLNYLRGRFPWVVPSAPGRWRKSAGFGLILVPISLFGWAALTDGYSPKVETWLEATRSAYSQETLSKVSVESQGHFHIGELDPQAARELLNGDWSKASRPALSDAVYTLGREARDDDAATSLSMVRYHLSFRDRYQAIRTLECLGDNLIPSLAKEEKLSQLRDFEQSWNEIEDLLLPSEMMEMDHLIYDTLFGPNQVEIKTYFPLNKGHTEQKIRQARALKVLGFELSPSPTEFAQRDRRSAMLEDWVKLRKRLEPLSPSERSTLLNSLAEQAGERTEYRAIDHHVMEGIDGCRYRETISEWFGVVRLTFDLREEYLTNGSYPQELPSEYSDDFTWKESEDTWVLTALKHQRYEKGRPNYTWTFKK